jgi:hypothetical protein
VKTRFQIVLSTSTCSATARAAAAEAAEAAAAKALAKAEVTMAVGLCTLNQVDPLPITDSLSNP